MKTCSVEGCNGKHVAKGFCNRHYKQMQRNGCITDTTETIRSRRSKNEIIEYEDYAEIVLYSNKGIEVGRALIDLDDIPRIKENKWYLRNNGYVASSINGKPVLLHRFIMNIHKEEFNYDQIVDHINRIRTDCRKSNLRICSQQENSNNSSSNRKVIAIIDNKLFACFDTVTQGAEYFNCYNNNISACCNKKRKSLGKYNGKKIVWRYLETIEI